MTSVLKRKYITLMGLLMAVTAQVNGFDYNPSMYCEPSDCEQSCGFSFNAELLYWRPELCGLEGAFGTTTISTTVDTNAITTTTITESDKEPTSKWDAGFRIGVGSIFDGFDLHVDWTHFNGSAKFSEGSQFGDWKIKYDTIDLTLSRGFDMTHCFNLRPFIGIRGAKIHQRLKSHLETLFTSPLIGNNTVFTDKDDKEDFKGIGPRIGLRADWELGCNFSLYGSFAVVSYYGDVKSKNFDVDTFTSTVSVCNGERKHCFDNLATDMEFGICWETSSCFCDYDLHLGLKLGVEQHRIYDFSELGSDGNLTLDGGVFAADLTFHY